MIDKVKFLLGESKNRLPIMSLMFLLVSVIDVLGLGLIGPFVSLVVNNELQIQLIGEVKRLTGTELSPRSIITVTGIALSIFFLVRFGLGVASNLVIVKFGESVRRDLKGRLLRAYLVQSLDSSPASTNAERINMIHVLTGNFSSNVLFYLLKLISEAVVLLGVLLLLASQSVFVVVSLVVMLVFLSISWDLFSRGRLNFYGEETNRLSAEALSLVSDVLTGAKELTMLNRARALRERYLINASALAEAHVGASVLNSIPKYLLELAILIFVVFIFSASFILSDNFADLIPVLAVFGVAAIRVIPGVTLINLAIVVIRHNTNTIDRIFSELSAIEYDCASMETVGAGEGLEFKSLELRNVSFAHSPATENILRDVSLRVERGDSVGIVGSSGSGKTTLINLMMGIVEASEGQVLVNDTSIQDCKRGWLDNLGLIPQEPFLLNSTVATNVSLEFDVDKIDMSGLDEALSRASMSDVVRTLPCGVFEEIGENGSLLSGGQRQRLILARAFYFGRGFLVLDEATSALDFETEEAIINEVALLKEGLTVVIISHRLSTLKDCNKIYEVSDRSVKRIR